MRLFIALTLLLMSFLSAFDGLDAVRELARRAGGYHWIPELVLALAAVALFVRASSLHRRLLYPRRGQRLLTAGIGVYAFGLAAATGVFVSALGMLAIEQGSGWSQASELAALMHPQPVFLLAQLLLVMGAFRALSNLVPPDEFAADY